MSGRSSLAGPGLTTMVDPLNRVGRLKLKLAENRIVWNKESKQESINKKTISENHSEITRSQLT